MGQTLSQKNAIFKDGFTFKQNPKLFFFSWGSLLVKPVECIAGSPPLRESRLALQSQQQECVAVPQVQIDAAILP